MSEEIKPGFYRQSLWNYINGPGINRSSLHEILRSAGHMQYKQENPTGTKPLRVGDGEHAAVLEPERFEKEYIVLPQDCKPGTKENPNKGMGTRKAAFEEAAEAKGQTILDPAEVQNIREMAGVIHADQNAMDLLCDGEAEISGYFVDPEYGILVKIRLDYINKAQPVIIDLKSCRDARKFPFRASAFTHGYDLQAYMGLYGVTQITGEAHSEFKFIAIESEGYHGLKIYRADDEMLATGYKKYHESMTLYKDCLGKDEWHGYSSECEDLGSPDYAKERVDMVIWD